MGTIIYSTKIEIQSQFTKYSHYSVVFVEKANDNPSFVYIGSHFAAMHDGAKDFFFGVHAVFGVRLDWSGKG